MKCLTDFIRFQLDGKLNETAIIDKDYDGKLWGFECRNSITGNLGYSSWEGKGFKTFDECYNDLKRYEKNWLKNLKYEL